MPIKIVLSSSKCIPGGSDGKESTCNVGDLGSVPGFGRSPGGGHGNLLQYSCLKNHMDRGARWTAVHGVAKSQKRLSDQAQHSTNAFHWTLHLWNDIRFLGGKNFWSHKFGNYWFLYCRIILEKKVRGYFDLLWIFKKELEHTQITQSFLIIETCSVSHRSRV